MSRYASLSGSLPAAEKAVEWARLDPQAHRSHGAVLRYSGDLPGSVKAFETAVSLRPLDDRLWSELAIVREELGDQEGALSALDEAVRTAPFYALPRWQRGNVLLRMRRYDEGFADLREAAISDPELQPNLIDLAWGLSRGDLKLTEQILQINKPGMRLSYARFLARKGFGQEALGQLRTAGSVPELLRKEIVSNLIGKKSFRPAFDIWLDDNPSPEPPAIFDGGFEASLRLEEIGFGWRVARGEAGMVLAVDPTEKQSGLRSLRIHFNGNGNPGTSVVSQLVVVKPLKRYRLNFASRSQEIVSGGLPLLIITGATTDQILGKGELVREGSQGWDVHSLEFQTGVDEEAIIITLKRQNCAAVPCPIFGILWLDSFSIEELNGMKN